MTTEPRLIETGWQTIGPFFHNALWRRDGGVMAVAATLGERVRLLGRIVDGESAPMADAMVEIWQANAAGRYRHPEDDRDAPLDPAFDGFGRTVADADGCFEIATVMPGRVPGLGNTLQAPHLNVSLFGRGLSRRLVSRVYFDGATGNDEDPVLALVPAGRRATLIARADGPGVWRWDVRLQGDDETVFFDL